MRPFFGIDITTDRNNENIYDEEFIVQRSSPELVESHDKAIERLEKTENRAKLPFALNIIKSISICFALIVFLSTVRAISDDIPFAQAYRNAPYLYWIAFFCVVVFVFLKIYEKRNERNVINSDEAAHDAKKLSEYTDIIYEELSVPEDARDLDILFFHYKVKNGEIKPCEKGIMPTPYVNFAVKAFTDNDILYLASLDIKYAIPLSLISRIRTVKKRISILGWNKDIGINEGIYKQYKLTNSNLGLICCKRFHVIEINHNSETYVIYIPDYELPQIEQLTGLKATEE
jgi:hypothetical protein